MYMYVNIYNHTNFYKKGAKGATSIQICAKKEEGANEITKK